MGVFPDGGRHIRSWKRVHPVHQRMYQRRPHRRRRRSTSLSYHGRCAITSGFWRRKRTSQTYFGWPRSARAPEWRANRRPLGGPRRGRTARPNLSLQSALHYPGPSRAPRTSEERWRTARPPHCTSWAQTKRPTSTARITSPMGRERPRRVRSGRGAPRTRSRRSHAQTSRRSTVPSMVARPCSTP